ncbi:hypothetical protein MUL_0998 [Mycobacterium ulcerans Agy99]|uniref:Uncharacterized protein n=1 Tax=Mycobacterium ulcerans (strain Agy99) TaxID=362242 RepID=A0PMP1_MYCUA|nr:hypothetical protein MUL_0998 [Mycobacterium ulcerans Agy99]
MPKSVQVTACGKVVAFPPWLADRMIADGRAKAAMIRIVHLDDWAETEVINPGLVVVGKFDLNSVW